MRTQHVDNGENVVVTSVESRIRTHPPAIGRIRVLCVFAENFFLTECEIHQSADIS